MKANTPSPTDIRPTSDKGYCSWQNPVDGSTRPAILVSSDVWYIGPFLIVCTGDAFKAAVLQSTEYGAVAAALEMGLKVTLCVDLADRLTCDGDVWAEESGRPLTEADRAYLRGGR